MVGYVDEQQASADGIVIAHEPQHSRYAVFERPDGEGSAGETHRLVGEAHYTLLGDDAIDFDHTVVVPRLRGTGLAGLLARHALTGEAAAGRRVHASCWFIAGYLRRHPELLDAEGRPAR